ncbi:MAG: helix-turn-helix domain-containing protein [Bacillota bacterium]
MRKVREMLRLAWNMSLSIRQVARTCGVSHSTVSELLRQATQAGLSWLLPAEWDDAVLEDRLYRQHHQRIVETRGQQDLLKAHPVHSQVCGPGSLQAG